MKTMIIFGSFVLLAGFFVCFCGIAVIREGVKEAHLPPPYTIVCDGEGRFSFTHKSGRIWHKSYGSREEVEAQIVWDKQWEADEASGRHIQPGMSEEQKARFKPCP